MSVRVIVGSAATALVLAVAAPAAQASNFFPGSGFPSTNPFTLSQAGSSPSAGVGAQNVTIVGNNVLGGSLTVSAGGFSVRDGTDRFIAWCLDTMKFLKLGTQYALNNANPFTSGPTLNAQKKIDIRSLFNTAYNGFLGSIAAGANGTTSAGFQLALWEIVNETTGKPYDIYNGDFRATSNTAARQQATSYLAGLGGATVGKGYNLLFLESTATPKSQNLVTVSQVPLPAAGLLLLAGLAGTAAAYRRKQRISG